MQAGISRARSRSYRVAHVLLALLQNRQGCELSRHPADVVLRGEKVRLRPSTRGFSRNELKQRYRWSKDTRLQYWSGPLLTDRSFCRFRRTLPERDWPRDGQRFSYAILTLDNQFLGMVSCRHIDPIRHTGELGIYIGLPSMWGKGYGTDAAVTLLKHLFRSVGLECVYLSTNDWNTRALRAYMRIGFAVVEHRACYSQETGTYEEICMSVNREHFEVVNGLHPPGRQ